MFEKQSKLPFYDGNSRYPWVAEGGGLVLFEDAPVLWKCDSVQNFSMPF